jgi:hypothetical protein
MTRRQIDTDQHLIIQDWSYDTVIAHGPHQRVVFETFRRPVKVDAFSASPEATT